MVSYDEFTKTATIAQPATKHVNDSSMYKGQSKTVQRGHSGTVKITYRQKYVDGSKSGSPVEVGRTTTRQAVATVVHVGTKARPDKVTYKTYTKDSTIPQPATKHVDDSSMYVGESKTTQHGHPGTLRTTYKRKYVNGSKSGSPVKVGSKTIKKAVATVIHEGTKPKQVPWTLDSGLAASTVSAVNSWRTAHGVPALAPGGSCSQSSALSYAKSGGSSGGCGMDAYGYTSGTAIANAWGSDHGQHELAMKDTFSTHIACTAYSKPDGTGAAVSCLFS